MLQRHPALCSMLDVDPCGEDLISGHVIARLNGYVAGYGSPAAFEEEWPSMGIDEKTANYVRRQIIKPNRGMC